MVLAEYNGGPLNAGYYRAAVGALAAETRSYVPRVLELYARLKDQFDAGLRAQGARRRPATASARAGRSASPHASAPPRTRVHERRRNERRPSIDLY